MSNPIKEKQTMHQGESEKSSDNLMQNIDKVIFSDEQEPIKSNQRKETVQKYAIISSQTRMAFIKRVISKQVTIKEAANEFGIKFSTSKAILQTYRKEGRVGKKKFRLRKMKEVQSEKNQRQQKNEVILVIYHNQLYNQQPNQTITVKDLEQQIPQVNKIPGSVPDLDKIIKQYFVNQQLILSPFNNLGFGALQLINEMTKRQSIAQQLIILQYSNEISKFKAYNQILEEQLQKSKLIRINQNLPVVLIKEDAQIKPTTPLQLFLPSSMNQPNFNLDQQMSTVKNL